MAAGFHRIGGGAIENLRLKPHEVGLNPPGISILEADSPEEAAQQIRAAYPKATDLHAAAATVGSSTRDRIKAAGFEVIPVPSKRLPTHYRLIHPQGAAGFTGANLAELAEAFTDTTGH